MSRAKKRGDVAPGTALDHNIFLIPELCFMTGLTEGMRNDRRVMQDLAKYTRVEPETRINKAREYLHSLQESQGVQNLFERWSLSLGNDVAPVKARVLEAERPFGVDGKEFKYDKASAEWSRDSRHAKLTEGVALEHWVFIYPEVDKSTAEKFFNKIKEIGAKIGMIVELPFTMALRSHGASMYLDGIKDGRKKEPEAQMVVYMIPDDNKIRYDAIKKLCCIDDPIPNQVFRGTTLTNNLDSVCTKIILQMNCKLGGSLWRVKIPKALSAMVIGYDAYHDSVTRGKSVGAAVFSMDHDFTKWFSQSDLHSEDKDLMRNLSRFCENGLKKYYEINRELPKIFLYRDGCGDGQIPMVYSQELPQVHQAFRNVAKQLNLECPKLTFIIVTKRVNTRFFQQSGNNIVNPPPGSVVDSVVTRSDRYDWFLVPQAVRQGTVTPVFDESELSPDQLQRLAYKLCHLYYNWQGTIRVPAPCQYAHKLAVLVAQSLRKPGADILSDMLYFL